LADFPDDFFLWLLTGELFETRQVC
jgi:hypothetical protein